MNSIAYPSKALTNLTTIATNDSTPKEIRRRKTYGSSTARVDEIRDHALQQVVNEVVDIYINNNENLPYGTISRQLRKYLSQKGNYALTWAQLDYKVQEAIKILPPTTPKNITLPVLPYVTEVVLPKAIQAPLYTITGMLRTSNGIHNKPRDASELQQNDVEVIDHAKLLAAEERLKKRGGRPLKPSAKKRKAEDDLTKAKFKCRNEIVTEALKADNKTPVCELISEYEKKHDLPPKTILASTISERLKKAKTLGGPYEPCFKTGPKGTIEGEIEDLIVEIILAHDVFGRAMNYDEIIQLANDLIRDTSSAEEIQKRKVRECNDSEDGEILGKKWIKLFLNRKKDRLKTAFPNLYEKNRAAFSSYDNFVRMYDRLEKALLLGKIAVSFVNRKLH